MFCTLINMRIALDADCATTMKSEWDIESAIATYNVEGWGEGYFTVNNSGNVEARPLKNDGGSIDLLEVVNEARARNLGFPLLIRFQDLLRHRVESINRAFHSAISEFGYQNHYRGVFPIKVNQLREVVEEIVDAGEQFNFGLEAGSKPELVAALAMQKGAETLIICNGYKDPAFIRLALLGRKLGKPVVIVAEKLEEVEQIIRASKEVGVEPWIGIRARLHSKGSGKWSPSGGENAKFGLDTTNLVAASQMLKDAGVAHCLKLVHFHVGSQVPDISTIKRAVREGARYYAKLSKLGHELGYLDVGGGLGVDYDGSRSDFDSSTNYSLQEYANDVVWNIIDVCDSEGVAHPVIVSESGRATVAHHSVLVVEAFSSIEKTAPKLKVEASEKDHKLVADILDVKQRLKRGNRLESLHDIKQIKEEVAANVRSRSARSRIESEDRHGLLAGRPSNREHASRLALCAGRSEAAGNDARRSVHLQFFRVPIAARSLGAWPVVPDHADPSAHHAARSQRHYRGYHLRFRRKSLQVCRFAGRQRNVAAASDSSRRNLLPRPLHGGRLPGHHG